MTIPLMFFCVLLVLGLLLVFFSRLIADALNKMAAFVFKFPCRLWPDFKVFVDFVFGNVRLKWFVRLLGYLYVVSAAIVLSVLLVK